MTRPHLALTLEELRRERALIDSTILALEILSGERPAPGAVTIEAPAPAPARKLLKAGRHRLREPRRPRRVLAKVRRAVKRESPRPPAKPVAPVVVDELHARGRQAGVAGGGSNGSDAAQRRAQLLELINKSDVGLTVGELRHKTPKMSPGDRSNALYTLKTTGQIRRVGNTWARVEAAR